MWVFGFLEFSCKARWYPGNLAKPRAFFWNTHPPQKNIKTMSVAPLAIFISLTTSTFTTFFVCDKLGIHVAAAPGLGAYEPAAWKGQKWGTTAVVTFRRVWKKRNKLANGFFSGFLFWINHFGWEVVGKHSLGTHLLLSYVFKKLPALPATS